MASLTSTCDLEKVTAHEKSLQKAPPMPSGESSDDKVKSEKKGEERVSKLKPL